MKTEDLQKQGLTQEQIDFVMSENGKDLKKLQRENETLTTDRDNWKNKAETAEETLKGFEGKDFDTITKERDEWKKKAEDAEKEYKSKMEEREKADLLKEAFSEIKFTSESAKRAIMEEISKDITVKNGELIGFEQLLGKVKERDSSAFVDETQTNLEKTRTQVFIDKGGNTKTSQNGALKKEDIMAIKDPVERQTKIAENIHLFRKG